MSLDDLALAKSSAKLLDDFKPMLVYSQFCNRDYEGDVKFNGSVKIYQAGIPTVRTYTRGGAALTYDRVNPGEQVMRITQRDYFALEADDLEKQLAFAGGEMWQRTVRNGAFSLAQTVDTYISGTILKLGVPSANVLAQRTVGLGLASNIYDLIVDLRRVLQDNNVPMTPGSLKLALPPAGRALLRKDDRFVGFNTPEAVKNIQGAPIGEIDGVEILVTTQVPVSGSTYTIICGSVEGTTYAEQLSKMENVPRDKDDFEDRVRSQLVFDAKVTQPQCLASCDVQFAS